MVLYRIMKVDIAQGVFLLSTVLAITIASCVEARLRLTKP